MLAVVLAVVAAVRSVHSRCARDKLATAGGCAVAVLWLQAPRAVRQLWWRPPPALHPMPPPHTPSWQIDHPPRHPPTHLTACHTTHRHEGSALAFPAEGDLALLKCAAAKVAQLLEHKGFTGQASEVDDGSSGGTSKWSGQPGFRWGCAWMCLRGDLQHVQHAAAYVLCWWRSVVRSQAVLMVLESCSTLGCWATAL